MGPQGAETASAGLAHRRRTGLHRRAVAVRAGHQCGAGVHTRRHTARHPLRARRWTAPAGGAGRERRATRDEPRHRGGQGMWSRLGIGRRLGARLGRRPARHRKDRVGGSGRHCKGVEVPVAVIYRASVVVLCPDGTAFDLGGIMSASPGRALGWLRKRAEQVAVQLGAPYDGAVRKCFWGTRASTSGRCTGSRPTFRSGSPPMTGTGARTSSPYGPRTAPERGTVRRRHGWRRDTGPVHPPPRLLV